MRRIMLAWLAGCGGLAPSGQPDAAPPTFPTGVYTCESRLEMAGTFEGKTFESVAGGQGTLTVTQSGAVVTAAYTGDTFLSGTMLFDATTNASAEPVAGTQPMSVTCFSPFGQSPPQLLSVTSGSLTVDGDAVFLSFVGTAEPTGPPNPCDGNKVPGTLTCTKQP